MMGTIATPPSEPSPLRRRFTPEPAALRELWAHEAPRIHRIVAVFDDDDLSMTAAPGSRSVAALVSHIAESARLTDAWIRARGEPAVTPEPEPPAGSVAELGNEVVVAHDALLEVLDATPADAFDVTVSPFGQPETLGVMAFGMFKHELHHRGELTALARLCGRTVPFLYG